MGRKARIRPERLPEKLQQIRLTLGYSQSEFLRYLGLEELFEYERISAFELGSAEPSLPVLLRYARSAGISTDVLIDDELDLPAKLPVPNRKRK
jgi:transcriptional regulator with XRE-family HTH domain